MIQKPNLLAACCALVLLLGAAPASARAQDAGPMQPPESTKFPAPPPSAKPEPPTLPPDEIIRRFAAKEDEMVSAIKGYTFQKDVRIQEIGPDNKPAGQVEIVTQLRVSPEGKMYEKPVSRKPSTLHSLDLQRGDADLLAPTPMFPLTTAMLPKYEITYGGKQPLDELNAYFFTVKPRALDRARADAEAGAGGAGRAGGTDAADQRLPALPVPRPRPARRAAARRLARAAGARGLPAGARAAARPGGTGRGGAGRGGDDSALARHGHRVSF